MIEESFAGSDCDVVFDYFNGECCESEINRLVAIVKEKGCDLVIGVGGGKILIPQKQLPTTQKHQYSSARPLHRPMHRAAHCLLYTQKRVYSRDTSSFRQTRTWF